MVDAHKERLYAVCHEYIEGECMSGILFSEIRFVYCRHPVIRSFLVQTFSFSSDCFVGSKNPCEIFDWLEVVILFFVIIFILRGLKNKVLLCYLGFFADLHNMYRILKPINGGLSVVIREFQNFVKKTGLEALKGMRGDNIPQQFVENVLQVCDPILSIRLF